MSQTNNAVQTTKEVMQVITSQAHAALRDKARKLIIDYCPEYLVYFCHPVAWKLSPSTFVNREIEGFMVNVKPLEFDSISWQCYKDAFLRTEEKRREWLDPFWTLFDVSGSPLTMLYESGMGEFILGDIFEVDDDLFDMYLAMLTEGYSPRATMRTESKRQRVYRNIMGEEGNTSEDSDGEPIEPEDWELVDLNEPVPETKLIDLPRSYLPVVIPTEPNPLQAYSEIFHRLPCPVAADQISWDIGSPSAYLHPPAFFANFIGMDAIQCWKDRTPLIVEFNRRRDRPIPPATIFGEKDEGLDEILLCLSLMGGAFRDLIPLMVRMSFFVRSAWWIDSGTIPDLSLPTFVAPAIQMFSVAISPLRNERNNTILAPHLAVGTRAGLPTRRTKIRVPHEWAAAYLVISDSPWPKYNKVDWAALSPALDASCVDYLLISYMSISISHYVMAIDTEGKVIGSVLVPDKFGVFNRSLCADSTKLKGKCYDCQFDNPRFRRVSKEQYLQEALPHKPVYEVDPSMIENDRVLQMTTKFGLATVHPFLTVEGRMAEAPKILVSKQQFTLSNFQYRPGWVAKNSRTPVGQERHVGVQGELVLAPERFWLRDDPQWIYTSFHSLIQPPSLSLKSRILSAHIHYLLAPTITHKKSIRDGVRRLACSLNNAEWQWCYNLVRHYLVDAFKVQGLHKDKLESFPQDRVDASHWTHFVLEGVICSYGACRDPSCQLLQKKGYTLDELPLNGFVVTEEDEKTMAEEDAINAHFRGMNGMHDDERDDMDVDD